MSIEQQAVTNKDNKPISFLSKMNNFFTSNFNLLKKVIYGLAIFIILFMFVMLMIPTHAGHSSTQFINQTSFYSVKYSQDFTAYYVSLTPSGIILVLMLITFVTFISLFFYYNKKTILNNYKNIEEKRIKNNYIIKHSLIYGSISLLFLLLFIFILIAPDFLKVAKYYYVENIKQSVDPTSKSSLIDALNKLGVQTISYGGSNLQINDERLTTGILSNFLSNNNFVASSFKFTPFANFNSKFVYTSNGIYAIIVLFAFFLFLSFLSILVFIIISSNFKIKFSLNKEKIELYKEKLQAKKLERQQMAKTKRELAERETQLLKSLNDVSLDKVNEEKRMGIISQEELEAKLSQNNELKKQLDELIKQKQEINKQKIANSKIRSALNKTQNQLPKPKKDKQTITIPDKELDEIFRNLEID